jgi:hypothetical protein
MHSSSGNSLREGHQPVIPFYPQIVPWIESWPEQVKAQAGTDAWPFASDNRPDGRRVVVIAEGAKNRLLGEMPRVRW